MDRRPNLKSWKEREESEWNRRRNQIPTIYEMKLAMANEIIKCEASIQTKVERVVEAIGDDDQLYQMYIMGEFKGYPEFKLALEPKILEIKQGYDNLPYKKLDPIELTKKISEILNTDAPLQTKIDQVSRCIRNVSDLVNRFNLGQFDGHPEFIKAYFETAIHEQEYLWDVLEEADECKFLALYDDPEELEFLATYHKGNPTKDLNLRISARAWQKLKNIKAQGNV